MIIVTGGTGTVGRALVAQLGADGAQFKMLVRDPNKVPAGVASVRGDLGDPASLASAFAGADALFLLSNASPDGPRLHRSAVDAAKAAGLKRVVRVSVPNASRDAPIMLSRWHAESDEYLKGSGLAWTILCPGMFAQNFLGSAATIKSQGVFYGALKEGKAAIVDARDIAAVASKVLTTGRYDGASLLITGPALLTQNDAAAVLTKQLGKPVKYVDLPPAKFKQGLLAAGLPDWLASDYVAMHVAFSGGAAGHLSPVVREVTQTAGRTFEDFVRDHVEAFR